MHTAWRLVTLSPLARDLLSDLDLLGLLLATLCHDLDHPGTTNSYLINSHADLAVLYNDQHVLVRSKRQHSHMHDTFVA